MSQDRRSGEPAREDGLQELAAREVESALIHRDAGNLREALAGFQRALAFGELCPDRTSVMVETAQILIQMGELEQADDLVSAAMAAASRAGDETVVMLALGTLGQLHRRRHDFEQALMIARDGYQRACALADVAEQATFKLDEAIALRNLDDVRGAIAAAETANSLARDGSIPRSQLRATGLLGSLLGEAGQLDRAQRIAEDGLQLALDLGDRREVEAFNAESRWL